MESIWDKSVSMENHPSLEGDLKTDAVVIGGGLAGILIAFFLKQQNIKTVVLEAAKIGSGQTHKTTAKITSQHNLIYSKLIKDFGEDQAYHYALANQKAILEYQRIIQERSIDCSFKESPAYLYSKNSEDNQTLEQETDAANRLGIDAKWTNETELPFDIAGAVCFQRQAQFNPMAFLNEISKELEIYENTPVKTVEDNRVITENGTITAEHIIFATHFPFLNLPGLYFARMHQERSYVLALKDTRKLDGMYLGIDQDGLSFRSFNDALLLGGGAHRTGENSVGGKYLFLRKKALQCYPQSTELLNWSAQDCITMDGVPYIGQYSSSTPNWYVATGFGKWGMTSSMVSATLISDMILGKENPYADIFSPQRFKPSASMKNLLTDTGQAVKGLTKQIFAFPETKINEIPAGHGGIIEENGEKAGIYKDEQQNVFLVSTRCPHLGCQLEWNPDEKSWDCPCHGSRFDYKGNILDNPAQENLENKHE